ncbi:hypothetical protein [Bacillus sp. USDA818B3_A]|uniref:hypothetical protein n=1 Tax=Bacillus sp. USDA818B3_A TaxID=2698834 RepID=UPI00136FA191|nr:hypothetical protein [Bacillus sp. USDA818B3_A]
MLHIWDIEKIIIDTLQELKLNINVEFSNTLTAPMSYNASTRTIKFNYLQINGYNAQINFKIKETDENFVKIILYHVLGYYLEFRKNPKVLRILLYGGEEEKVQLKAEIDENSWNLGRTFVPENLLKAYDQVRELDKFLLKSE